MNQRRLKRFSKYSQNSYQQLNLFESSERFKLKNRRYLGAKTRLLPFIKEITEKYTKKVDTIADIFAGTGVVGEQFLDCGKKVIFNDILKSNTVIFNAFFDNMKVNDEKICKYIDIMNNRLPLTSNYVSENYGDKYFSMENAKKIGQAREYVNQLDDINDREKNILITSILFAADKVANTVGHYDAYRKKLDNAGKIYFKIPNYLTSNCENIKIYSEDANELVKKIKADLIYIDTPYNSRQYGDIYHVLENIATWTKPKLYGVARKPKDRSSTKSLYSTSRAPEAFEDLIKNITARYVLVSYNNMAKKGDGRSNAKISNEEIIDILSQRGKVKVFSSNFQVFTTGKTNIKNHKELLYLLEVL